MFIKEKKKKKHAKALFTRALCWEKTTLSK
jgi:hypothetical protein